MYLAGILIIIHIIFIIIFYSHDYKIIQNEINKIYFISIKIDNATHIGEHKTIFKNENNPNLVLSNKGNNNPPLKNLKIEQTKLRQNINYSKRKIISNIQKNNGNRENILSKTYDTLLSDYDQIMEFNDYEMNNLKYEEALKFDKRTYIKYYLSLLRTKHLLIFAFLAQKTIIQELLKYFYSYFLLF